MQEYHDILIGHKLLEKIKLIANLHNFKYEGSFGLSPTQHQAAVPPQAEYVQYGTRWPKVTPIAGEPVEISDIQNADKGTARIAEGKFHYSEAKLAVKVDAPQHSHPMQVLCMILPLLYYKG